MQAAFIGKLHHLRRKSRVGQTVMILLFVELLFFSTFIGVNLPTATQGNLARSFHTQVQRIVYALPDKYQIIVNHYVPSVYLPVNEVRFNFYTVQAPLAILIGYVLGPVLAPAAVLLSFLIAFVGPWLGIYALPAGGGLQYLSQPGFGYLIGLLVASWCAGRLTAKQRTTFSQVLAVVCGLLAVHVIGLAYLFGSCLINSLSETANHLYWRQWLFEEARNFTWYPLPYDIAFGLIFMGLGFPLRFLTEVLTAPDIGFKSKSQPQFDELLDEDDDDE